MQEIHLTEAEARVAWAVAVSELGAAWEAEEHFVADCLSGTDRVSFLAAWPEIEPGDRRSRRVTYGLSEFSLVEGPLRFLCSEQATSTSQIWAAADASDRLEEALTAHRANTARFRPWPRVRLGALAR